MNNENVQRVDKNPAAIFSVIVFMIVFLIGYMFYPQLSMIIPFAGEKVTMSTDYKKTSIDAQADEAVQIVVAVAGAQSKVISGQNAGGAYVYKKVDFTVKQVIKGNDIEELSLVVFGGSALFKDGTNRAKKYNVTYTNEAEFSRGETYILFLDQNGRLLEGKFSVMYMEKNGTFRDYLAGIYTIDNIKNMVGNQQK